MTEYRKLLIRCMEKWIDAEGSLPSDIPEDQPQMQFQYTEKHFALIAEAVIEFGGRIEDATTGDKSC